MWKPMQLVSEQLRLMVATLANSIPMFQMMKDRDPRGILSIKLPL